MSEPGILNKYGTFRGQKFYAGLFGQSSIFLNFEIYDEIKHYRNVNFNIDGTFSIVPKLYKQLLIILVEKEDRVSKMDKQGLLYQNSL